MNPPRLLSYALVALAAGAGGYFLAPRGEKGGVISKQVRPVRTEPETRQPVKGFLPAGIADIMGTEPLTAENANAIMYRALEESSPVSRMAAVGLLLESMTPETGPAIYQAFLDITTKSGRRLDGEWSLMLKRYGEVMGAACFQQLLPERQNLALAIEGWAAADPDGVLKALKDAHVRDTRFDTAWLTGICRTDPEKALKLALTGDYPIVDASALITQSIHTSGLDGAREALQKALDAAPETAAGSQGFQNLFDALADSMLHKNWTEGTPGEMLKWLEEQKGQPYVSQTILNRGAHDALMKGDAAEAVSWLERMREGTEGDVPGAKGVLEAVFEKPDVLGNMSDETFKRLLPLLPQSASGSFRALATMLANTNPARAEQLRAIAPPE